MSTNLCRDTCDCGYRFCLEDFRGQPVEFRQYGRFVPNMGVKLTCPVCAKVYFGWIRSSTEFWGEPRTALEAQSRFPRRIEQDEDGEYTNLNELRGSFVYTTPSDWTSSYSTPRVLETGYYEIDLAYYESYSDEGVGIDTLTPNCLFEGVDSLPHRRFLG